MTRMVCKHCGSEDVWRDAIAVWNGRKWELSEVMTVSHCDACGGETTIVESKVSALDAFLSKDPTLLATHGDYRVWEHPTMGDTAPVFLSTPDGRLINTGFYDLGDFDLDLCVDLSRGEVR